MTDNNYEGYITVREMAEKLGISRPRVHQIIKLVGKETVIVNQVGLLSPDTQEAVIAYHKDGQAFRTKTPAKPKVVDELNKQLEDLRLERDKLTVTNQELTSNVQILGHENDLLKADIRRLTELLASKDKELTDLDSKYTNLDQKLQQQQELMLVQLEKISNTNQKLLEHKEGFWSRLFK